MPVRCAILDDYQRVALEIGDWSACPSDVSITVFDSPLGPHLADALLGFEIVCLMRERTAFERVVIEKLDRLKLIVTTGMRNAAIDVAAARERGILVCGTGSTGLPTAELVFGHLLEFCRGVGQNNQRLKAGAPWQHALGRELEGRTLGIVGLGRLGGRVAAIGQAFGMEVIAWSENLTEERCREAGARYAPKFALLEAADFVTLHLRLSERTRGLMGAAELAALKADALLVNTSRGPIVDETALLGALRSGSIGGAALDVFDEEPLPADHPLRTEKRAQITPHLGYSTEEYMREGYTQMAENIAAFLAGTPLRVLTE